MLKGLKQKLFPDSAESRKLLLYGLQRSGTNYLESLMQLNYPACRFLNGANRHEIDHKHFRLYDDKNKIPEPQFLNQLSFRSFSEFQEALPLQADLYIVISKDPYSWYLSYSKWSEKNKWPEHDYHYIEEYNLFYGRWMEFSKQTDRILFIRYIDLLRTPLEEINKIGKALNLSLHNHLKTTKKVYASRKFTGSKKEEFLNQVHLKKITAEDFKLINETLNKELIEFLGYDLME